MAGDLIGFVKSAQGVVDVRGPDGKIRSLLVGDELHEGDTVLTTGGGQLVITLAEGGQLTIEPGQVVAMTSELSADRFPGADESQVASVDDIVQAVLAGKDLDKMLEATAAGPAGGAGANEGHSFVQLLRVVEPVGEVSGNTTSGIGPNGTPSIDRITPLIDEPVVLHPPVAVDDSGHTREGKPVTIGILDNDSDADGDALTITDAHLIDGAHGSISLNPDNTLTFKPGAAFNYLGDGESTTVQVEYTITDGNGGFDTAIVTITITGTNEAPQVSIADDSGAVIEDASDPLLSDGGTIAFDDVDLSDSHTVSVAASDGNTVGGTLTAVVSDPATGAGPGTVSWTYTVPNADTQYLAVGQTVTETFTVTIDDGHGGTQTSTVTVTVTGTNDAPTISAAVDTGSVTEGAGETLGDTGTVTFDDVDLIDEHTASVTASDSNPLGGTLTAVISDAATGAGSGNIDWTYSVPGSAAEYLGEGDTVTETFTITIDDGHGGTVSQDVTITITGTNDVPVVTNDAASVTEDESDPTLSTSGAVTITDTDQGEGSFNPDSLVFTGRENNGVNAGSGQLGTLVVNADGTYTYTVVNSAVQFLGEGDSIVQTFNVTSSDGTATSTITITINGTNDVPVVTDDAVSVTEDESDPTLSTAGAITITDTDQGEGSFDTESVQFTGRTNNGVSAGSGVLGSLIVHADGTYDYSVANSAVQFLGEGDSIVQTFTVRSSDGTATSTITITINGTNDVPVVTDDAQFVVEDSKVNNDGTLSTDGQVTITDTDQGEGSFDTDSVQFTGRTNNGVTGPSTQLGTLVVNADGTYTYTVDNSAVQFLGQGDTIVQTFTVDSADGSASSTITITIYGTNDVPSVTNSSASVTEDESDPTLSTSGAVAIVDVDQGEDAPDSSFDPASLAFTGRANNGVTAGSGQLGTLTVNTDGTYTFTVANSAVQFLGAGDSIVQTFTVQSSDGTATSTITITINGTNDVPQVTNDSASVTEDQSNPTLTTGGAVTITDTDQGEGSFDTSTLAFTGRTNNGVVAGSDQLGTLVVNADGTYTFTVANSAVQFLGAGDSIVQTFTVQSSDGTATSTITITINGTNDVPQVTNDSASVTEDQSNPTLTTGGAVTITDTDQGEGSFDTSTLAFTGRTNNGVVAGSGQLGTLVVNADGTYTYSVANSAVQFLGAGDSIVQTFTVDSADGSATSTITITINGTNDVPQVTNDSTSVTEDQSNPTLTAGGTVTITDTDQGESSFDPGSVAFTGRTNNGVTAGTGQLGTLTVNPDGTYTFTVADSAVQFLGAGDSIVQTFTVDSADGTATSTITVTINGTNDIQVTNSSASVTEDQSDPTLTTGGAVTITDADQGEASFDTSTLAFTGRSNNGISGPNTQLGTLSVNPDGTYTFNVANNLVQALGVGDSIVQTFTVQSQDHTATSTITITINGTNDKPTIVTDSGNPLGAHDVVYEAGLPAGTGVGPTTVTAGGTITLADPDGLNDLQSVTINGTTIAINNLVGSNVAGPNGTLTITAYNAATGVATYSYALTSPATDGAGTESNTFTVTTSDGHVSSDPATIVIDIVDDVPTLTADNLAIANVAGTSSGSFNFDVGADVQSFAASFNSANSLTWANPRDGFSFSYDTATQTGTATFNDGTGTQTFFTVHLNSNGTYDFNLVTPDPVTVVNIDSLLAGIAGGSNLASFTLPSSNFDGEFQLVMTGYTNNGATNSTITISSASLGVGDNVMHGSKDDVLRFDVQPIGGSDATVTSLTVHVDGTSGWKANDSVSMTVHYADGTSGTVSAIWGADASVTFNFDPSKTVDYLDMTPDGTTSFKIDGVSMGYTKPSFPDDYQLNFNLTGDDKDGDTATDGFSVNVNTTDTSTFTVVGTAGADSLHGTPGNDTFTGAGGSDTFVWNLADHGTAGSPALDKITDFNAGALGSGGDVLDLRDLLVGDTANSASSLDNYLHFTQSGGTTTVQISTSGGFSGGFNAGAVDQQIQLQGVDLTAGGTLNDQQIIQNLLNNGNLHQ